MVWELHLLDEVCDVEYGTRVVRKKHAGTKFPVYGGGGATFNIDEYNRENCLIVSRFFFCFLVGFFILRLIFLPLIIYIIIIL